MLQRFMQLDGECCGFTLHDNLNQKYYALFLLECTAWVKDMATENGDNIIGIPHRLPLFYGSFCDSFRDSQN